MRFFSQITGIKIKQLGLVTLIVGGLCVQALAQSPTLSAPAIPALPALPSLSAAPNSNAVDMTIPGLGMPLTRASREWLRELDKASWLLGDEAKKNMTLLFSKGEDRATLVGFGVAGGSEIQLGLRSLGIEPNAIMPSGQRRYGTDAITALVRKSEKFEAPGVAD